MLAALALFALTVLTQNAAAQSIRAEVSLRTADGYGRLAFKFSRSLDAQVRLSGNVLLITFPQPVTVSVDRIHIGAPDWIRAARRDPDGRSLRFALARKFKLNTIAAAEWLFVDLLPDAWSAALPSLPQNVVEELAKRAKEVERLERQQAAMTAKQKIAPVRVRVAHHVTFTRYVFELPELIGVSTDRGRDRLSLKFSAPLGFDLADGKLNGAAAVESISATRDDDTAEVKFKFSDTVDVRTFREDFNYVVDVSPIEAKAKPKAPPQVAANPAPPAGVEPPETVPAKAPAAGVAAEKPNPSPATREPAKSDNGPPQAPPALANETPPPAPSEARPVPTGPVAARLRRQGDSLRIGFAFPTPTPAAVLQRADTVWLVFDTAAKLDVATLESEASRTIRSASLTRVDEAQVLRLRLERPRLTSVAMEGTTWSVTIGEAVQEPTKPLGISRSIVGPGRTSAIIPFDDPRRLLRIKDPEVGDTLFVITGLGPSRGFLKTQEFVEFRALATTHGVAIEPLADDLNIELSADKILIGRPGGLTLSDAARPGRRPGLTRAVTFDSRLWGSDRKADFTKRQSELFAAAADSPPKGRAAHRLDLARFYLSREMFAEAKAVLDVTIAEDQATAENPGALVLRAVANIMLNRIEPALKDLSNPRIGKQNDSQLWRAIAQARIGKWSEAREGFRHVEGALATLPLELQRLALSDSLRASIELGDLASAMNKLNDFETVGVPPELEPSVAVLTGRLAEGMGRKIDALASYRYAAQSADRLAAAQGRLRQIMLRNALGEIKKPETITELELLTVGWRGDETETEALQMLARLYTEDERFREAFHAMRTALTVQPGSEIARHVQDEAAVTFDRLFLGGKAEQLPAIDALSLFYDYRELTPIGRRGDEMIRRLAERLVSVDLLDQAAELLQHQVDNRLQGAARAQVATRLAVIYLLAHKPHKAQATLRATRTAELAGELRTQRLLLEARALSDIGRHDFALEAIADIEDREAIRLRSDIYWAMQRWQKAAEQIELLYGERWRAFESLNSNERSDILRAGIGYVLAEDAIGIARLREKYAAKFSEGADRRAFAIVTGGLGANSAEFREVARLVASVDTLDGFLRDMRARYPEISSLAPAKIPAAAVATDHTASTTGPGLRAARR